MDADNYKDLHEAIEKGDIEAVRYLLHNEAAGQNFSHKETSALYKAFSFEQYEIASYLIHKGAKIDDSEVYEMYRLHIDLTRVNLLLLEYNKKSEKSCIFRLLSWSQSPQGLDGERLNAVMTLYEDLFKSEFIKQLMNVVETESSDIVYDFESEDVNRIHRLYELESEIYGLTLSKSKEIFIGAKHLLSGDPRRRAKVYGVVAEELCHLALTTVFENDAKPYKGEHFKLGQEFKDIVLAVSSSLGRFCHVESVIKDVFDYYEKYQWECELIARVPHVIGIYGEEIGRGIFLESPELSRLLFFYQRNVLPKCRMFTEPSLNTKPHRMMERLVKRNDFISFREKQIRPLKEGFPSFREYLEKEEVISVITTNCIKLCTLHVYHELKVEYGELLEKKCLFFTSKCFEIEREKILNALKGKVWEYLILVVDEKEPNPQRLKADYLEDFGEFKSEGIEIIMISGSHSFDTEKIVGRSVNYNWEDLSEEYKTINELIRYLFKGEEQVTYVRKENFPNVFSERDITRIMRGELTVIDDGAELFSKGYIPETYIDRKVQSITVDRKIFENLPPNTSILLSGLNRRESQELLLNERLVQWLNGSDDEIQNDKSIFIIDDTRAVKFDEFVRKNPMKTNIWLHHYKKVFNLRDSNSFDDVFKLHVKQMTFSEKEILNFLESKRVVIISDNAGCGKSTLISSLIRAVKSRDCQSWLWRIDLNKFSSDKKDPRSLANIDPNSDEEDVIDHLFLMLGINHGLEKQLFRKFSRDGRCFIFFDGFDEIPSKYTNNALKLLSTLNEKSRANMIITTRKHHQIELEQLLNTHSYQLVPFSAEDQGRYLQKLWKSKLKYPHGEGTQYAEKDKKAIREKIRKIIEESKNEKTKLDSDYQDLIIALGKIDLEQNLNSLRSEIDELDFSKLAENVLVKTPLDDEILEVMGIPLHLYMVGNIHFNGNFYVIAQSDIYSLYSQFIEQKILIYVEEKQGLWHDGRIKDDMLKMRRKDAYRIHVELADQFMDEEKVNLASEMDEEDLELCSALGIVFIQYGEIQFLHQTFAEYFKAESLRQKMQEQVFIGMLFGEKYNLVRRILLDALNKKDFEIFSRKLFKCVAFLVNVMKEIINVCPVYLRYESDSHTYCLLKITKKLLQNFELMVEVDIVNEFINTMHGLVMKSSIRGEKGFTYMYPIRIGCCFTVYMIKYLLRRDFKVYSRAILTFVRYSEHAEEVIDVLKECISMKTAGGWWWRGLFERENKGNKKREADRLMGLFSIKNSIGDGLLSYALCNERTEIFACILKFFRDVLGRERFIATIVRSAEYRKQVKGYLENVDPNRICSTIKALSVFEDEMGILFDRDSIFRVFERAYFFDKMDPLNGSFEKVISLFQACFGSEELKEILLSEDNDGNYLVHNLVCRYSSEVFMKHLNLIKNILDDKETMKQVLKSCSKYNRNVFHLASNTDIYFYDLLRFCDDIFEKDEIKEMLLSTDEVGNNVIHGLLLRNPFELLMKNLKAIKDYSGSDEWLRQLLKSKGSYFCNAVHFTAENQNEINPSFFNLYLTESDTTDLLMERDEDGHTCLHFAADNAGNLSVFLDYVKDMLNFDRSRYEELILGKDNCGNTFLHRLSLYSRHENVNDSLNKFFSSLREKISNDLLKRLLETRNDKGETFLQIKGEFREKIIKFSKEIFEADLFEELFQENSNEVDALDSME